MVVIQGTNNEAILRYRADNTAFDMTVADGTAITKGALLKITDPNTAIISSGAADMLAGIAARDKIASDGRTQLAVIKRGVFEMVASGAITVGFPVMSAGVTNMVKLATPDGSVSGAAILGTALETFADQEAGLIQVNVGGAS